MMEDFTASATEVPDAETQALIKDLEARGCKELHRMSAGDVRDWFDAVISNLALSA